MEYVTFGSTGLKVSELCLGSLTFGREVDDALAAELLSRFEDVGGNFVDTANAYNGGLSEEIVGRWLRTRQRDDIVIGTKVRFGDRLGPNNEGLSRKHIIPAVERSLRRLQTDYIDVLHVHCWDSATPLLETLATLNQLVAVGKVRYVGVSNFVGWQLQKCVDLAREHGWEKPCSLQAQYSLLCRTTEWELAEVCRREGMALVAWAPLAGGWLTGRMRDPGLGPEPGSRIAGAADERPESWSKNNRRSTWRVVDALIDVASEAERTPAQVALNWLVQAPGNVIPVVGADAIDQLDENVASCGWSLSDDQRRRLDAASAPELVYPYDFVNRPDHRR